MDYQYFLAALEEKRACASGLYFAKRHDNFCSLFEALNADNRHDHASWLKRSMPGIFSMLKEKYPIFAKYDRVYSFSEGFATVKLNGKYGFINEKGEEITDIKYDFAHRFFNGFAAVKLNGKYGFINEKGEEITALKYESACNFFNGFFEVELNGKWLCINEKGEEVEKT